MTNDKTGRLVLTALMACLVLLATYMIRIPSPFTQGYIHLGDTMIFLSVLVLVLMALWGVGIVSNEEHTP